MHGQTLLALQRDFLSLRKPLWAGIAVGPSSFPASAGARSPGLPQYLDGSTRRSAQNRRNFTMLYPRLCKCLFVLLPASATMLAQVAVTTQHNDLNRTGANLNETILNTSNVNASMFGKLCSRSVDGQIYAQPLYVPNVTIPAKGVHNVVYVCTEHNSAYAFDADDAAASAPLWQVNFGPAAKIGIPGMAEVGITSTPVIDRASNTMYVVAQSAPGGTIIFQLHALDITNGTEKFNGPVTIQGSVPGPGAGSVSGVLAFA